MRWPTPFWLRGRRAVTDAATLLAELERLHHRQADHIVALVNGGENRERNLRCLCSWCHKNKTADDVAEKAKTAAVRKKHLGIKTPSRFPTARNGKFKQKIGGKVELR